MKKQTRITYEIRKEIERMYNEGYNVKYIARTLDISYRNMWWELARAPKGQYTADVAQADRDKPIKRKHWKEEQNQKEGNNAER